MFMFKRIVVGVDGSPTALEALKASVELARCFEAELHIVGVARLPIRSLAADALAVGAAPFPTDDDDSVRSDIESAVAEARELAEGINVETHALAGDASESLIQLAEVLGADLIVVGNKGMTGAGRFLLGSVPNRV